MTAKLVRYDPKQPKPKLTKAQRSMVKSMQRHSAEVDELLRPKLTPNERIEIESRFVSDGKRYIIQRPGHGETCSLIALANACTYLGMPSVRPGSKRWERIAKIGGCVAGSCINIPAMAEQLNLEVKEASHRRAHLLVPFLLSVWTPDTGYHSVLVVDGDKDALELLNYLTGDQVRASRVIMPRCELYIPEGCKSYAIADSNGGTDGTAH